MATKTESKAVQRLETAAPPAAPEPRAVTRVQSLERDLMALAETPAERAAAFRLGSIHRQSEMIRMATNEIAGSTWGQNLSIEARKAVAVYALQLGVDPVRHIDVLGSKLYINADCYLDYAASQTDYEGFDLEYINNDERATPEENERRKALRVKWNTPEDSKGICVVTLHRKGKPDVQGCNWAGNRKGYNAKVKTNEHNSNGDLILDPIGEQEPGKTSFTRAFRRAARTAWPLWFAKHPVGRSGEDDGADLDAIKSGAESLIASGRQLLERSAAEPESRTAELQPGLSVTTTAVPLPKQPEDPYGEGASAPAPDAKPAEPKPAAPPAEQGDKNPADEEITTLKNELREVMKADCISDDDRRIQEKLMAKPTVTIPQLRRWIQTYKDRVAEWDAGK